MAVINSGSHPKALWPGVKNWWGLQYKKHDPIWPKLFKKMSSTQAYEEDVEDTGFGLLSVKPEGQAITYDSAQQGTVSRYSHVTYASGYIVTMEQLMNNLYNKISFKSVERLAKALYDTEETVHANVFNRAFNAAYTGGDGVSLISTAHPTASGNQSNALTTAADLSESAIEDLITQIKLAVNSRGLRISLKPRKLVIPSALWWDANRILQSTLQNDSANNAINVVKGVFPEGIVESPYLTDTDAWFVITDNTDGLTHYTRMEAEFDRDQDFDTRNAKAAVISMWSQGWSDFRGVFGTPG
jgi:hypothetical protein